MSDKPTSYCPICSSLEESLGIQILGLLQKKNYAKNAILRMEAKEDKGLYLIAKGSVKVSKISNNGKELVLKIISPGEIFGEMALFDNESKSDVVTTLEACQIFFLSKNDLEPLMKQHKGLFDSVISSLLRSVKKLNDVLENINTDSAEERVMLYIARLKNYKDQKIVTLDKKKYEVALMLGIRPETFSRALKTLEEKSFIKMTHRQIEILIEPVI